MKTLMFILVLLTSLFMTSCFEEEVCSPNPCQNDGTCSESLASYKCECPDGFTGRNCEIKECTSDSECQDGEFCNNGKCTEDLCDEIVCALYCENGFKKDANGCNICECIEEPVECTVDADCDENYHCELPDSCYLDENGELNCPNSGGVCVKDIVVCPEIGCELYCENGFKKDSNGCDICECIETPTECTENSDCDENYHCELPLSCYLDESGELNCPDGGGICVKNDICPEIGCELQCDNGFKQDANGCDICECIETPTECTVDADCAQNYHCERLNCGNNTNDCGSVCVKDEIECGGIAGVECPQGMICEYSSNSNDATGTCVEETICPEIGCELYCENGFKQDANGCDICECIETPTECTADVDCDENYHCELPLSCYLDESGELNCPDDGGICVKNDICPEIGCELQCDNGFKQDANGCDICECIETPTECTADADCAQNYHCERLNCGNDTNDCGSVCVENDICPEIGCELQCENGLKQDANGCDICECN